MLRNAFGFHTIPVQRQVFEAVQGYYSYALVPMPDASESFIMVRSCNFNMCRFTTTAVRLNFEKTPQETYKALWQALCTLSEASLREYVAQLQCVFKEFTRYSEATTRSYVWRAPPSDSFFEAELQSQWEVVRRNYCLRHKAKVYLEPDTSYIQNVVALAQWRRTLHL
jgi:hypothetical protein